MQQVKKRKESDTVKPLTKDSFLAAFNPLF